MRVARRAQATGGGRRAACIAAAFLLVMLAVAGSGQQLLGADDTGITERASVDSDELELEEGGEDGSISANGNFVAFVTNEQIDPRDTNSEDDIYLRDRAAGITRLVTLGIDDSNEPGPSDDGSSNPVVSADGRFVAFDSFANNLSEDDGNPQRDVFVADMAGADPVIDVVSVFGEEDDPGDEPYSVPSISGAGDQITFQGEDPDCDSSECETFVFVRNRDVDRDGVFPVAGDQETRLIREPSGIESNRAAKISGNGKTIVYVAMVPTVDPDQPPTSGFPVTVPAATIVAYDRDLDGDDIFDEDGDDIGTDLVNAGQVEGDPNGAISAEPSVNADGSRVTWSFSTTGGISQIYAATRTPAEPNGPGSIITAVGATVLISRTIGGTPGNDDSRSPAISADGTAIAFETLATDLHLDGQNSDFDCFESGNNTYCDILVADWDGLEGVEIELASVPEFVESGLPEAAYGNSINPTISGDGTFIAFESSAYNLLPAGQDSNLEDDVFVRERRPEPIPLPAVFDGTPDPLDFGAIDVDGGPSAPLVVSIFNAAVAPAESMTVLSHNIEGANAGDFVITNSTCVGATLGPGAICLVEIRFDPTADGLRVADLVVTDTAPIPLGTPHTVRLTGGGTPPTTDTTDTTSSTDTTDTTSTTIPDDSTTVTTLPTDPNDPDGEQVLSNPTITVNPGVGTPGTVTVVTGFGWPAGASVELVIEGTPRLRRTVVTDGAGQFRVPMLILPRSQLGPRRVIGTADGPDGPITVATSFLAVVPSVDGGNDFIYRR